jgi:superfamily II DNA or RNA helicase
LTELSFAAGTLEVREIDDGVLPAECVYDARTRSWRAPGVAYASVVTALVRAKIPFEDKARKYVELDRPPRVHREPRPFQLEAVEAWEAAKGRGVVVLPTGAGKTHVAVMAIERKNRSALVVAPTLDLVRQWYDLLGATFGGPIGLVGGGSHEVHPITVTTYDSAHLHMEHMGARFGLVIFDECHHLPSAAYALAARACIAPFRLGLTATPERTDARELLFGELVGPIVYRKDIVDLSGEWLADYETQVVLVDLSPEEREEYERERATYRAFIVKNGIDMRRPEGWGMFIMRASRSTEGRRAMAAHRRQKQIALAAPGKLEFLGHLLAHHGNDRDRVIVFTQDNATAYAIARRFLVPIITHQTRVKERSHVLGSLRDGTYGAVVTSKVLNEGVDVPDANVAVVLSGSGSVREHVQRLGRVLRKKDGKSAILYELVTARSGETWTSDRRREHSAYR